jgi:hypothetical protein
MGGFGNDSWRFLFRGKGYTTHTKVLDCFFDNGWQKSEKERRGEGKRSGLFGSFLYISSGKSWA